MMNHVAANNAHYSRFHFQLLVKRQQTKNSVTSNSSTEEGENTCASSQDCDAYIEYAKGKVVKTWNTGVYVSHIYMLTSQFGEIYYCTLFCTI